MVVSSAGLPAASAPPSWRAMTDDSPRPRPRVICSAMRWSYISRNIWFSPGNSESPKLAARMLLISICANWPSNWRATLSILAGSLAMAGFSSSGEAEMRMSDLLELGTQRASLLEGFQDRDQIARRGADLVHRAHDFIQRRATVETEHAAAFVAGSDGGLRHGHGLATAKGVWLADLRRFADGHRQRAVGDRRRADPHLRADHHRAGARIDHDAGRGCTG